MGFVIKAKFTPSKPSKEFGAFVDGFDKALQDAHRKWVFMVLEYIVRYSRLATGRSRAGWTAFMDAYGYPYQRSLQSAATESEAAIAEGRAASDYQDEPLMTTIINNVKYVDPMNRRYGLFGFSPTAPKGEGMMSEATEQRGVRRLFKVNEQGNRVTMGIRLEEKVPMFEDFGNQVMGKFMSNAKAAYEVQKTFGPGPIAPVENEPPQGF